MARTDTLSHFLTDVADSIRNKTGKSASISPDNYDTEVGSIGTPSLGVVFSDWDSNGYPTKATFYGYTSIWRDMFHSITTTFFYTKLKNVIINSGVTEILDNAFCNTTQSSLTSITLPNTLTKIGIEAFYGNSQLQISSLPDSITYIGNGAFKQCSNLSISELPSSLISLGSSAFMSCPLNITKIPDGVTFIPNSAFYDTTIKKISMVNVTGINGTSTTNGSFKQCIDLKQVWIGSAISTSQIQRYSFYNCTSLEKIYIDLPRATVEAFTNYQYAFMDDTTKTSIIICNDDNDFITKSEFDSLVIT